MPKSGVSLYEFPGRSPTITSKRKSYKCSRQKMKIFKAFVIDDDCTVLSFFKTLLQRRGYEVHAFGDPVQSPLYNFNRSCCSKNCGCPDLIISDYNMPGVNGVELLESAMENGCHCRHLALITGKGLMEGDLIRVAKYGTRYFTKPLDFDDFYDWLNRVELQFFEKH